MSALDVAACDLDALDQLGPVLCRIGGLRATLSWQAPSAGLGGYYAVDWKDRLDRFFSGTGDTPSAAVEAALVRGGQLLARAA